MEAALPDIPGHGFAAVKHTGGFYGSEGLPQSPSQLTLQSSSSVHTDTHACRCQFAAYMALVMSHSYIMADGMQATAVRDPRPTSHRQTHTP